MANQYSEDWDKTLILSRVKEICNEVLKNEQRVLTRSEWDKKGIIPSRRTIEKYTDMTFIEVMQFLGYPVRHKSPKRYTEVELLTLLRIYFDELKKKPKADVFNVNENFPNVITYQRRFGSWSNALELAGFSKDSETYDKDVDITIFNSTKKERKKKYIPKMKNSELNQGKWTEEEDEILRCMYLLIDYKEIAAKLNRSYNSVKVRAKRLGLTKDQNNPFSCITGETWSEEELNILRREYSHNPKIDELLPKRNMQSIIKKANKVGEKMRRGSALVNSGYFEDLTPQSAYIAGFIAADGYINEKGNILEITLSIVDLKHLEKIANELGDNIKVTTNKAATRARLSIINHKLIDDLVKMNIVQRKSFALRYFEGMPEHLHSHFIRGYLDGDGSIMPYTQNGRVSFIGNKYFLESIRTIISEHCDVNLNCLEPKGKIYDLRYHGSSALKVLDWLYYKADLFLDRKFEKYKELGRKIVI